MLLKLEAGNARPGHIHCQMHKLWKVLAAEHTHFQGIQHHRRILFQTGIKLSDDYIKQTLYAHTVML